MTTLAPLLVSLWLGTAPATHQVVATGDGARTAFTFGFNTPQPSWVEVWVDGTRLAGGYQVALSASQGTHPGGTVTFAAPPRAGGEVVIRRVVPPVVIPGAVAPAPAAPADQPLIGGRPPGPTAQAAAASAAPAAAAAAAPVAGAIAAAPSAPAAPPAAPRQPAVAALPFDSLVEIDLAAATEFELVATSNAPFTIGSPEDRPGAARVIVIRIKNDTAGPLGAITWGDRYRLAPWTSPAAGCSRTIEFGFDGARWIERFRSAGDVPN